MSVADKTWWGPRIWRILHSLAEINDRTDAGPAWRPVLHLTANILPCAVCRAHFQEHVRHVALPVGVSTHAVLRRRFWEIHHGSKGTAPEEFPEERLATEYGEGGREAVFARVTGLVAEVVTTFRDHRMLDRFHMGALMQWQRAVLQLAGLLRFPQLTPSAATARGRYRR